MYRYVTREIVDILATHPYVHEQMLMNVLQDLHVVTRNALIPLEAFTVVVVLVMNYRVMV